MAKQPTYISSAPQDLIDKTDYLLFSAPMSRFLRERASPDHDNRLDWSSDGCTHVTNDPLKHRFLHACQRHDFGYLNYGLQNRCSHSTRKRIDGRFLHDMYDVCETDGSTGSRKHRCKWVARFMYEGVRLLGSSHCKNK
jgi:hypothetical protein